MMVVLSSMILVCLKFHVGEVGGLGPRILFGYLHGVAPRGLEHYLPKFDWSGVTPP